jgi:protein TonB
MKLVLSVIFLFIFNTVFAEQNVLIQNRSNHIDTITVEEDPVFLAVENQPEFPGGLDSLNNFIARNVRYPPKARELGIEGKVYVVFVVEKDGSITNIKILRGVGQSCDEEAKRVVRLMPNFIPGKQNGRLVRVQYIIPINFKLSSRHK